MHNRVWMPLFGILFSSALFANEAAEPTERGTTAVVPAYSRAYDPARDPYADGRDALALARDTDRRVLIELGGEWCQWCHVLERFWNRNARVRAALDRHFVLLKVNVSEENDNATFLAGLPPNLGFPHIYVAADDGQILHSQDTAEFLVDGHYDERRMLGFIERWRTPDDDVEAER